MTLDGFEPDEPHKKVYVDKILKSIEHRNEDVGVYNSAIELGYDDNGYEFLYAFAKAVLETGKDE